jgi:hypothetical protein
MAFILSDRQPSHGDGHLTNLPIHRTEALVETARQELLLAFHFDSRTTVYKIAFDWPPFLPGRSYTGTAI